MSGWVPKGPRKLFVYLVTQTVSRQPPLQGEALGLSRCSSARNKYTMKIKQAYRWISSFITNVPTYKTHSWVGEKLQLPQLMSEFERADEIQVEGPMVVEAGPRLKPQRTMAVRWAREIATMQAAVVEHNCQLAQQAKRMRALEADQLAQKNLRNQILLRENPGLRTCRCGSLSRRRCTASHCHGPAGNCDCIDLRTRAEMPVAEFELRFERGRVPPRSRGRGGEGEVEGLSGSSFLNRLLNYTALKGFPEIGDFLDHVFRNEGIYLG